MENLLSIRKAFALNKHKEEGLLKDWNKFQAMEAKVSMRFLLALQSTFTSSVVIKVLDPIPNRREMKAGYNVKAGRDHTLEAKQQHTCI